MGLIGGYVVTRSRPVPSGTSCSYRRRAGRTARPRARRRVLAGLELERVADRAGVLQVLVAAAMIEVIVRVDDEVDVLRLVARLRQRARQGLLLCLDRLLEWQHLHDVGEVVAGVEQELA